MRKAFLLLSLCAGLCLPAFAQSTPLVRQGDLVVVAGDSITEQKIYSVYIEDYILMCSPAQQARVVQFGWSGDTAHGFVARQIPSLQLFKPQVVTTLFGMNDGRYAPLAKDVADNYRKAMTTIARTLKEDGVRDIILGTPGACGSGEMRKPTATPAQYNETLRQLGEIVREVAEAEGTHFADVHSLMMDVQARAKAKYGEKYHLCGADGIHPAANGHLVMAYALLKTMGFDGEIGTITVDMASGKATATEGHEILGVDKKGAVSVRSIRYPFCFYGDAASPNSPKGILEFIPFNQNLNRYMLVVKNAPPKVKVTWGEDSQVFTAAELAQGVNLAEAFLDNNPFHKAFEAVNSAARGQQGYETVAVKVLLQSFVEFRKLLPNLYQAESEAFARLGDGVLKRSAELCEKTAAMVTPVEHTITLEPTR